MIRCACISGSLLTVSRRMSELWERPRLLWVVPSSVGAQVTYHGDRKFHECQGHLLLAVCFVVRMARKEAGPKSTGNLFEGPDGQAATVAGARLGKQACHENSHGVEVGNDDE